MAHDRLNDDRIHHGIDDDPNNDPAKGAVLGGIGGAAVGAAAGAMAGPAGAIIGAVVGGVAGAAASAAGVAAVDQVDNDNTMTGLGDGYTTDDDEFDDTEASYAGVGTAPSAGAAPEAWNSGAMRAGMPGYPVGGTGMGDMTPGNDIPGIQTGGRAMDGTPDTRGVSEKAADALTGNRIDDKTGKPVT